LIERALSTIAVLVYLPCWERAAALLSLEEMRDFDRALSRLAESVVAANGLEAVKRAASQEWRQTAPTAPTHAAREAIDVTVRWTGRLAHFADSRSGNHGLVIGEDTLTVFFKRFAHICIFAAPRRQWFPRRDATHLPRK